MTEVPTPQERKREQNYSGGWDASAEDFLLRTYTERSMLQPSWKRLKISVSLTAVLVAMGKTDFSGCFQHSVYCRFCSSLLSCSAQKRFTTWPLSRQNRRFLCAERAKSAKIMRYDKVVAVHSLGPDVFLLAALGKRAKGKEICQEAGSNVTGGRIRIAKVPTFAFPTDSYGMQTKSPFATLPGLQCWRWFKLTGCT